MTIGRESHSDRPRPRILLVDDDELVLGSLGDLLAGRFDVVLETDAFSALAVVHREAIAAVVTDYKMPRLSGIWLLRQVRQISPATRRVLMSGDRSGVPVEADGDAGLVERFVDKPMYGSELEACLTELLSPLAGDRVEE